MGRSPPNSITFELGGPITRTNLPGVCDRFRALLERGAIEVALCDVSGAVPDCATIDALARLQLAARRHGCRVRLHRPSSELLELLDFVGLSDVVRLGLEPGGQPEERKHPLSVEEERELDDLSVCDLEHLQCPWIEAAPRSAPPVLPERWRPIRRHGREHT